MSSTLALPLFLSAAQGERFTIIGGGVRILIDGASSGGQCCMFEALIPPGDGPPRHRHQREDELFYVLDGRFRISIDGRESVVERGGFACAPRGTIHTFKNIGDSTGVLLVTCTPAGIETPFRAIRIPEPRDAPDRRTPAPAAAPTMEHVTAELAAHGITFHGPPLE
ncbi:MAG: cupin domain-containing protein [Phycisphaerae bacterium]|nr:cupin domain-containing protein [Phycisphaerae bacterium]